MKEKVITHTLLVFTSIIFGANYVVAKSIMPDIMTPFQVIFYRVLIATSLFVLITLFIKTDKIPLKDIGKIAFAALFGIGVNQMFFYTGLTYTTPINASIIHAVSPIIVILFAAAFINEKMTWRKLIGVLFGFLGVLSMLLFQNKSQIEFYDTLLGNAMILLNITGYALYLVLIKPLMTTHNPVQVIKWVYVFGLLYVTPFSISEVFSVDWSVFMPITWSAFIYLMVGTSVLGYLFTSIALSRTQASTVGLYIYMQPVVAAIISLVMGTEPLTFVKIISAIFVFIGVYLVSTSTTNV